jgi:hypothetical protein
MKRLIVFFTSLAIALAASATTLNPIQLLNPTGSTSGQAILSTGASSAPAWGNLTLGGLQTIAANTVIGNATGSTASPTAITVTGCNGAAQALQWTSGSGFGCNSNIATSGANANITSLSGLSTALTVAQGGTGRATLTAHGVLVGEGTSAINQLAVGTTGQVLVGSTGADPAFGTTVAGLTFTSAITPQSTGGIVGTTTNDAPNAGSIGEIIQSTVTGGSAVSISSTVPANITSISLTAGDWDVCGETVTLPAGTTTQASLSTAISLTSATIPALTANTTYINLPYAVAAGISVGTSVGCVTERFASTTTVYLVVQSNFSVSTNAAFGWIFGRRRR